MVFRELLEVERTIRTLNEKLKNKAEGYTTEFKINGQVFSEMSDHKIEIILLDPQKKLVAYRPHMNGSSHNNNKKWSFGDYKKAVKDAFSWRNKIEAMENETDRIQSAKESTKDAEYTLMGLF